MANEHTPLFDKRIVERHIARGLVTREEYDAFVESLEDCSEMADVCDTRFVRTVADGSDLDDADR